ncbi:amidohydrolase family protein [Collinsella tanakaei]|uniref:amidohydrolase family protein n=1 Tax=Collinsella tanakaei TaxID=626935 RepID=UPI001956EE9C|nr:amidohydrolase family protein [Collinsella tanakaei]MBM6867664.1 amidohydrolase family protein [Collinsella tanakaei]
MVANSFVLAGDICYSTSPTQVSCTRDGYLVCIDGVSAGVFETLPDAYASLPRLDCTGQLIVPGMSDIHLHAPQYAFRGIGMDLELIDWLDSHAFPEEAHYADLAYAERAYGIFVEDLKRSATTRAVVFATLHVPATELLMDKLEQTGLITYVGKVNMDRNSPDDLRETREESARATRVWAERTAGRYARTRPIITPRFTPSVSDPLMADLAAIREEFDLPVQSHLSENLSEIDWVRELCPWSSCYADAYGHFGLLGPQTIMAHCVHSGDEEIELLRASGTYVAHCPQSNAYLASGIAPARRYLERGVNMGLGTDIAGGASLSMFRCMADAVAASKLRWRLVDQSLAPLTAQEAFWLATVGGGSFFGQVGSFAPGYELDALVLDDAGIRTPHELGIWERVERYIYLAEEGGAIARKFVAGRVVI